MHQISHNAEVVTAVVRVCAFAYGIARQSTEITIQAVEAGIPGISRELLDEAVDTLDRSRLLRRRDAGRLALNATGKRAYEEECVPEVVFGDAFVIAKYGPAVGHVLVRTPAGDEHGATGFFIAEPISGIATAKHVLQGNRLLGVETRNRWRPLAVSGADGAPEGSGA